MLLMVCLNMLMLFNDFSLLVSPARSVVAPGATQLDWEQGLSSASQHPWVLIVKSGAVLSDRSKVVLADWRS